MTDTVVHDARHPSPTDALPQANYLLLPLTVPADIATSPIQLLAFISYCRGDRPNIGHITRLPDSYWTNQPTLANQNTNNGLLHVIASDFHSSKIERELNYYVANFSTNSTNHFYVGATELDNGNLVQALVYWKEPRILMDYGELTDDAPEGAEIFAWQGHHLKLDRDTVDTADDIAGSTYLETHHQWVDWMEQCIFKGKLYVVTLDEATNAFPNVDRTKADNE